MSAQHTKGLVRVSSDPGDWSASHDGIGATSYQALHDEVGNVIALIVAHSRNVFDDPDTRPNAARLAACWNACDGIQTDLLTEVPSIVGSTMPYRILRAQHTDLVAKLQMAIYRIEDMLKDDDAQALDEASKFLVLAKPLLEAAQRSPT